MSVIICKFYLHQYKLFWESVYIHFEFKSSSWQLSAMVKSYDSEKQFWKLGHKKDALRVGGIFLPKFLGMCLKQTVKDRPAPMVQFVFVGIPWPEP